MSNHRGRRSHRTGLLVTVFAAASMVVASPVAAAEYSEFIPAADNVCGVDILLEADFLPTDHARIGYGDISFTNLENGVTFMQRSRYLETWTYDASTDTWSGTIKGRKWTPWYPGEPGPAGVVQEPGLWILSFGKLEYTVDGNDVATTFSLNGTYIDVCEKLTT